MTKSWNTPVAYAYDTFGTWATFFFAMKGFYQKGNSNYWASSFLVFVILRVKHVVHPKSGHEMSEKYLYKFLYSTLSLNASKYCLSQTRSNWNDNLSRKLRSASILTCFRPSRATWRCRMGEFEKWAAKGFPPNYGDSANLRLRGVWWVAGTVLARSQGFHEVLTMYRAGCQESVIQEMSQSFCSI